MLAAIALLVLLPALYALLVAAFVFGFLTVADVIARHVGRI